MRKVSFLIVTLLPFLITSCLPAVQNEITFSLTKFAKNKSIDNTIKDFYIASSIRRYFFRNVKELYTKIKVEVIEGRVLYTGLVSREEDIIKAIKIAWDQEGVTEVINELQVDKNSGTLDLVQYIKDTMITTQIKSKTFLDKSIKFINYTVITVNDIVYLFGIARSKQEIYKVATIASNISGVKKVVSHVKFM